MKIIGKNKAADDYCKKKRKEKKIKSNTKDRS